MRKIKALTTAALIGAPITAHADCGALQPLVLIHDGYRALTSGAESTKRPASELLLRLIPIYSAKAFEGAFDSMALDVDATRLDSVLVDGFLLARDVHRRRTTRADVLTTHTRNADWLTNLISRSGCFRGLPTTSASGGPISAAIDKPSSVGVAPRSAKQPRTIRESSWFDWRIVAGILGAMVFAVSCVALYRSRPMRQRRVERQPREHLAMLCQATHKNETKQVIFLDISLGGAKVEWRDPPEQGSDVSVDLPIGEISGSVVWRNAFYAGVLFDRALSADQVSELVKANGTRTRSKLPDIL